MIFNLNNRYMVTSLTVGGSWSNTQYTGQAPTTAGLTFTANYNNGTSATVTPSVSPSTWGSTAGTQTATFSYTENGITVTATKTASVVAPWTAKTITLTNPNSALAFRSISGNLYTNSACTAKASKNTKYTGTTFYYKSTETKPTGSYIYNYGNGGPEYRLPSRSIIESCYREGSLTACLGKSGWCWSSTKDKEDRYYRWNLSQGYGYWDVSSYSYHRVRASTF